MTREENIALCEKYPFLIPRNAFSGRKITDGAGFWPGSPNDVPGYDYEYTMLDLIPSGWREAFGIQFCDDLKAALSETKYGEEWYPIQIKEKYGELRIYANWYTQPIFDVLNKYEALSRRTCIECGKPATKVSIGWISPYCDECATKISNENFLSIDKFYKNLDLS